MYSCNRKALSKTEADLKDYFEVQKKKTSQESTHLGFKFWNQFWLEPPWADILNYDSQLPIISLSDLKEWVHKPSSGFHIASECIQANTKSQLFSEQHAGSF